MIFISEYFKTQFRLKNRGVLFAILLLSLITVSRQIAAKDLYLLEGRVWEGGQEAGYSLSDNNLIDLLGANLSNAFLNDAGLTNLFSIYTPTSQAQLTLFVGGIPVIASYAANSTTLVFEVPSLNITRSFTGQTRDESATNFANFLEGPEGQEILNKLLQGLAEQSPISPVAGNPNSLQSTMAASTFSVGTGIGILSGPGDMFGLDGADLASTPGGFAEVPNLANAGGDVGFANSDGHKSVFITLPLRYSYYLTNPQYAITLDLPLTYINTEGVRTGTGSFGLSLRVPILDNWYITPSIRAGATGSEGIDAVAIMYSGDISSSYRINWGDLRLNIGNTFGYYETAPVTIGDNTVDYDLQNTVLKNGLSLEGSLGTSLFSRPGVWQVYVVDTHFFGDRLFLEHYNDIGVLVGTRKTADSQSWDAFQLGLAWTTGNKYNAIRANLSYRF
ncbi:hypothetical protein TI04_05920 [Achromatium sp. WMS2]|nr:hypothetical protein TI04_05920 [Achromatium sp. WMS2]